MQEDSYWTLAKEASGEYSEKRSKFLAFAFPVTSEEEALARVQEVRAEYYDARRTRSNDDGEPSGTAGKPILGILISQGLTDLIVLVVRYFGGVKLGTSGLIEAYREATLAALEGAERKECILEQECDVLFAYDLMGIVMRQVKEVGAVILDQDFRETCRLRLSIRLGRWEELEARLGRIYGVELQL